MRKVKIVPRAMVTIPPGSKETESFFSPKTARSSKESQGEITRYFKIVILRSSVAEEDLPPGPAELKAEEDYCTGNFRSFESLDEFLKSIEG